MSMPKPQTNSAASPAAAPAKKKTKGPLLDLKARIERLEKLPPMPEMAVKILRLSADPNAHVKELVEVIELDPSLASQIMRYASSPFFAYQGKIDSVHTAITRVLGYNTVMNLGRDCGTALQDSAQRTAWAGRVLAPRGLLRCTCTGLE